MSLFGTSTKEVFSLCACREREAEEEKKQGAEDLFCLVRGICLLLMGAKSDRPKESSVVYSTRFQWTIMGIVLFTESL